MEEEPQFLKYAKTMFILNNALSFLGNINVFFLRDKKFRLAICSEVAELCPFYQMGNPNSDQKGKLKQRSTGVMYREMQEPFW